MSQNKIGIFEYSRMSFDERDRQIFWGMRGVSRAVRVWWWWTYRAMSIKGRIKRAMDRRLMNRASGRYYDRTIAWKDRRLWWSQPYDPDAINQEIDGDWVDVGEPITAVKVSSDSVLVDGCTGVYRLTGDPNEPMEMRLEQIVV